MSWALLQQLLGLRSVPAPPVGQPTILAPPIDPRIAFGAQGPQSRPAPQSKPTGGLDPAKVLGQMGAGLAWPFKQAGEAILAPQQGNESYGEYYARRGLGAPYRAVGNAVGGLAGTVGTWVGGMMKSPNDQIAAEFQAIIGQESGGRQFDKNGRPLTSSAGAIGIAQVMPKTGPEAARLAGLPWDEKRYRTDPQYNYQLGLAYYTAQRQKYGNPALAAAAYNTGPGNTDKAIQQAQQKGGNPFQYMHPETQSYVPAVMARMGQMAGQWGMPPPSFNDQPWQNAMGAQDRAAAMLQQPYSADFQTTPLPTRPAPAEIQAPDFAAGNAALEAARPKNPFDDPKERVRTQRQQYWKGIGQAMASLSGGEGIGTMLMKLGAGALMGRARGEELIDVREEEFEQRMAEYNRQVANREDQKASVTANVLNQNIAQRNQYAEAIWSDNVREIQKWDPQVSGNQVVTFQSDPADPTKKRMTVTPIGNAIAAEAELNKANMGLQLGQAQMQYGQWAYGHVQNQATTAMGMATQLAMQSGQAGSAMEGAMVEAANRARATVRAGNWKDLFGRDVDNVSGQLDAEAQRRAYSSIGALRPDGSPPPPGTLSGSQMTAYQDAYEDSLTALLTETATKAGTVWKLFTMQPAQSAWTSQRGKSERTSVRRDARGRMSSSTSWDMGE